MNLMRARRSRHGWARGIAACVLPTILFVSVAGAQPKDRAPRVVDRCDPAYVPKKGETPPTCPGVKEIILEPAKGGAPVAPTPPPVPGKAERVQIRRAAQPARAVVNQPGFRMTSSGATRIYLQVHGTPKVHQYETRSGLTYVLSDARVPVQNNRHPLMTQYFNTPVADAQLRQVKDNVHLRIDLRAPASPQARFIELVPGKVVVLEVTFPPGNYYQHIPVTVPNRRSRGSDPNRSGSPPPGARGSRTPPPAYDDTPSNVLGPAAP